MNTPESAVCARDGCTFHVELVLVADMTLLTTHCGAACADFEWMRRGLEAMEETLQVAELRGNLRSVADALDARTDPTEIGALIDG
ncbi:hypothetical protein OG887_06260 [Streptomyces sp. NBC_00053]|uniref:hypothetical protein n=1 Tax=unclassified Streptomyces TaxID=2593676 RepID=UPI00224F7157|nr:MULTISPECIES: hypothetical protein [unclassified Streptomyces]MCX5498996.1 hypothetical protein [Streptomyces sp. NBC_00052]MCX5552472.1 hypothetical protein [Streptomyces sp. NBC_00051]